MNLIGTTTINPIFFYTGKISGYFTWIILFLAFFNIHYIETNKHLCNQYISIALLIAGLIFTVLSLLNLGRSTRLGLPTEITSFKTNGLYMYSRNPMYVGFNLITIASIVYSFNLIILIPGIYSVIIYHFIILGEEKFLENRFGKEYFDYKEKVRRYI